MRARSCGHDVSRVLLVGPRRKSGESRRGHGIAREASRHERLQGPQSLGPRLFQRSSRVCRAGRATHNADGANVRAAPEIPVDNAQRHKEFTAPDEWLAYRAESVAPSRTRYLVD